jgi:hypothetical protein
MTIEKIIEIPDNRRVDSCREEEAVEFAPGPSLSFSLILGFF